MIFNHKPKNLASIHQLSYNPIYQELIHIVNFLTLIATHSLPQFTCLQIHLQNRPGRHLDTHDLQMWVEWANAQQKYLQVQL